MSKSTTEKTSLPFVVCDVFTQAQFGGNPLAVITDAQSLTGEQMQQIAREFNYSETTFVLPPKRGGDYQVRIFTASTEFPFAGHPNIGTAIVLAEQGLLPACGQFCFEELAGDVPVTVTKTQTGGWWAELRAPEALTVGATFTADFIAELLSLVKDEIVITNHEPMEASVGLPFILIELRDRNALQRAQINNDALRRLTQQTKSPYLHLYVRSATGNELNCRMFAPTDGVPEDPATGSANCALAAVLTQLNPHDTGEFTYQIAQGVEMGRPSELKARVRKAAGHVSEVYIGGSAVMFSRGEINLYD